MIITHSQIAMAAKHSYQEGRQVTERLEVLNVDGDLTATRSTLLSQHFSDQVSISAEGSLLALQRQRQTLDLGAPLDARARMNQMILAAMYEAITGRKLNLAETDAMQVADQPASSQTSQSQPPQTLTVDTAPPTSPSAGPGAVYERRERYQEREQSHFAAEGVVRTKDGREINISVSLNMTRHYVEESSETMVVNGAGKKIDPLVLNFDGRGAELSQTRFAFDLDNDGTAEQIASLRPGSGFLALDNNGDGIINNGAELFGPSSGRGFDELAQFDEDGNNFIDEADSIYHKLRIWSINEDGSTQLVALGDKQVGAIFLGHVTSPFQLKDTDNNSLGEIANSGIYLTENGQVGAVQEVYLTV